jgi:putative ABC transport system substrate-binding protein
MFDLRRREFVVLLAGAAAWPLAARAQQPGNIYRIGFLANDPTIPTQSAGKAFLQGLQENGLVEGKNLFIERRFAEGRFDRASELAAELVRLNVGLIVVSGTNNAIAASNATKSIPIVMANVFDPTALGIVASLAFPGGNITGLSNDVSPEMASKRLALLKEAVPQISRVAVLMNPDYAQDQSQWEVLERAARTLNLTLQAVALRRRDEFETIFASLRRQRPDALLALRNPQTLLFRKPIVEFAAEARLPAMYAFADIPEAGGLMSYGPNRGDLFRHSASYVAKILKGAKPADLPIEQPTKFELVINLKAAKALGIEIPPTLLARADEVIE